MQLKKLLQDDDAVSPVIGVILMVAITVILAAVIASFVLGMGNDLNQQTPQASFNAEFEDDVGTTPVDRLTISHESGSSIALERLSIISSQPIGYGANNGSTTDYAKDLRLTDGAASLSDEWTAGQSVTVSRDSSSTQLNGATIRVVYTSADGGSSSTLHTWEGPDA